MSRRPFLMAVATLLVLVLCYSTSTTPCFVEGFSSHSVGSARTVSTRLCAKSGSDSGSGSGSGSDSSEELREKAAALRREVEAFEATKQQQRDALDQQAAAEQQERQERRLRYSAEVPILKGDGTVSMERCDFPPRLVRADDADADGDGDADAQPLSEIFAFQAPLPLGIVLGQEEYDASPSRSYETTPPITVDDLAESGNAFRAGIRSGDILRACTACQVTMEQPTWQLLVGGIGRPKTTRMMVGTDDKALEQVLETIASNGMDPEERAVWLVVERPEGGIGSPSDGDANGDSDAEPEEGSEE
mmetsp:Transcript_20718/g.57562  ORF Transcript_20718/g.57562 Transcript_20718/m.57562 type:complete len:304 (+) Transcript_20718:210-1121(+)